MAPGFTDYQNMGVLPLQDDSVDSGWPIDMRKMVVGGRVHSRPEPGKGSPGPVRFANDRGLGTLGDVHPWFYWAPLNRGARYMGSWAQAWSGMTVGGGTGGFGNHRGTGSRVKASSLLPFRAGTPSVDYRYRPKFPGWPRCFSANPQGTMMMVMPGTREGGGQHELMLHADPRICAPHTEGPGEAGTLVVDLQPEGRWCMKRQEHPRYPGVEGRAARIQSMMRVVPMEEFSLSRMENMGAAGFNSVAWNLSHSGVDGIAGFGICYIRMNAGGGGPGGTRPPPTHSGPLLSSNKGKGEKSSSGSSPCDFGEFKKKTDTTDPQGGGGHGSTFMANPGACGPITGGSGLDDKHLIGLDADDNPITSGHISKDGYFFWDSHRDGPLYFEGMDYPECKDHPHRVFVHLDWDNDLSHKWIDGNKQGMWRWWSSFCLAAPITVPPVNILMSQGGNRRGQPPRRQANVPLPPGGGPRRSGQRPIDRPRVPDRLMIAQTTERLGDSNAGSRSLYQVVCGNQIAFSDITFRPQRFVIGAPDFHHSPYYDEKDFMADEATRPQVLACRVFGAMNLNRPTWTYQRKPDNSRARGGTGHGGILFSPPSYDLHDYYQMGSNTNVRTIETASWVTVAPGVGFAFGTPKRDGGLQDKSVIMYQDPTDTTNEQLLIGQYRGSVATTLVTASVGSTSAEVAFKVHGNQAITIPRGTTAQQPSAPAGGEIRILSNHVTGVDVVEYWDQQGSAWIQLNPTGAGDLDLGGNEIDNLGGGSAAAPSLSFDSDGDTGMWSPAANSIGWSVGGTQHLWLLSSGRFGVGASPGQLFDATESSSGATVGARVQNTASGGSSNARFIAKTASGGGDCYFYSVQASGEKWGAGLEVSTGRYIIANGNGLGTNPALGIESAVASPSLGVFMPGTLNVGGSTATTAAQLRAKQGNTTAAIPVLELDQDDIDAEFIEFDGTSAASAARSLSSWTAGNSIQGFIRVTINGTTRWIPFYDAPTS